MKQFAFTMLGWANMFVGCFAMMGIGLSVHDYYQDHWTTFHWVSFFFSAFVSSGTTVLCFLKGQEGRQGNEQDRP